MFSSKSNEWETPQDFFDTLNAEFHFDFDVCALPENAKVARFITPALNSLSQDWVGTCWMNPPYGRKISAWVRKAFESAQSGAATVVCLLPARTDTAWWHEYCVHGEIRFVRGRLKFGGSKINAPFPSAVVVFRRNEYRVDDPISEESIP